MSDHGVKELDKKLAFKKTTTRERNNWKEKMFTSKEV
jgi:hypothetical protein